MSQTTLDENDLDVLSNVQVTVEDVSYVIFTSGSTGRPKAVSVLNRNIVSHISSATMLNIINGDVIVIQIGPCSFDVHIQEILASIVAGSTIAMLHPGGNFDIKLIWKVINSQRVTCETLTTEMVAKLMAYLSSDCKVYHGYGPSECTLAAAYHLIVFQDLHSSSIPIGRPMPNYQCYVLDEYLQLVGINQLGELYIGGAGVFSG
ncbi:unnamed protein product, partial [Didymodactylos carnosus]